MVDHISKIVVSDTTAITYLAEINELSLRLNLFKIIYIPEAVFQN